MEIRTAGIIAEYNPFHNGHAYHIQKTRDAGFDHIAVVMSSNIVQRGDIAILDAKSRAKAAVMGGADLVIELPPPYCCGSAQDFAAAGVYILKSLGAVNALSFGSESADLDKLAACAEAIDALNSDKISGLISKGRTYPQALAQAMGSLGEVLDGANNTLAVEYIRALRGSGIEPFTVKRTVGHDSSGADKGYASASAIRKLLMEGKSVEAFVPEECAIDTGDLSSIDRVSDAILFRLICLMANELSQSPYASDGIARRIEKFSMKARDLNELYAMVKTRNVTHARVRRAVLLAALGVKKEELLQPPPYARVLAANKRGAELLSICKKTSEIPVSSSLAELAKTSAQAERCVHLTELASWLRDCARVCGRRAHVSEASRWFEIIRGGDSSQNVKI